MTAAMSSVLDYCQVDYAEFLQGMSSFKHSGDKALRCEDYMSQKFALLFSASFLFLFFCVWLFTPLPLPPLVLCMGWVGVGWQRHCKTCRSLLELDNHRTAFFSIFFWRSVTAGCRVWSFVRDEQLLLRTSENLRITQCS